ncbi:S-adenosyl-L-methionine-dependent methyltransferase [Hypoxylon fuscum]|nr:S-adenosyl-L-methionine-dependent methyltransferase [Hypoxylon fuscum]
MSSENDYVLTRDYLENSRLNLFHYQWVELFGYHTHPKIPINGPKLRIADVGTGTGVWLTDLAARLPSSVQLDGLDISFRSMPPKDWLPSNVALRQWDIKGDVPDELVCAYDVVHLRNFVFVLKDGEMKQAVANVKKIIKPGGFLQWGETDIHGWRVEKANPGNKIDAHKQLMQLTLGQDTRLQSTWIPTLAQLCSEAGFTDVETDCQLILHELIPRRNRNDSVGQEVKRLLPEVHNETVAGACFAMTRYMVVGRKPGAPEEA